MNTEKKILFGVDNSEFAIQAVAAVGGLLKNSQSYRITLFYGAHDPNLPFFSEALGLGRKELQQLEKVCSLQETNVLEQAKRALTDSGFDSHRIELICEAKCTDPAYHLLQLAARAVEHVVTYFSHLRDSKFTFFHVIPPLPPQYWDDARILDAKERQKREEQIDQWMEGYAYRVEAIAAEGKEKLITSGVPEENVFFKIQAQERGIARDILAELENNNHGILVIGRKGSKEIKQFGLGSKAHKLLHNAHALVICIVN
ncbi:MAG: universal stress protein [Syntrophobacterales bacterium]